MSVHKFVFQYSKFAVRIKNKCIIKRSSSIHRLSTLRQVDTQKQLLMSKNILKQKSRGRMFCYFYNKLSHQIAQVNLENDHLR